MSEAPIHAGNTAQADYWNGVAGRRWRDRQDHQDEVLKPVSDQLIATADPKPGERVIDVGCGCGATTHRIRAARRARRRGSGLDISEPMLARARERAEPGLAGAFRRRRRDGAPDRRPAGRTSSSRASASCSSPIPRSPSPIRRRPSTGRTARLRLLARGQAKSLDDHAIARSRASTRLPCRRSVPRNPDPSLSPTKRAFGAS